jgi:Mlc titration factor MtfA (ptsG expression regulator)
MIFSWLKKRRRQAILATPFPVAWRDIIFRNVPYYRYLEQAEQARLCDDLRIFVAEKHWEGCGGLEMTDEIKVTIAANACLLVLGLEHDCFDRVRSILVYPGGYTDPRPQAGPGGIMTTGEARLGEATRGVVVLSWAEVREETLGRGHNVVFHEFAHQLDMLDGVVDGTPPLGSRGAYARWRNVMTAEYRRLCSDTEHGRATLLDKYGTRNEAEFFAVATECFFERATQMRHRHPELYNLLRDYYRQDPADRIAHRQKRLAHGEDEVSGSTVL